MGCSRPQRIRCMPMVCLLMVGSILFLIMSVVHVTMYKSAFRCIAENNSIAECTIIGKSGRTVECSTGAPRGDNYCKWFYYDVHINLTGTTYTFQIITREDKASPCSNDPGYRIGETHTCYLSIKDETIVDAVWWHNFSYVNHYHTTAIMFGVLSAVTFIVAILMLIMA